VQGRQEEVAGLRFATRLYAAMRDGRGNLVMSPWSLRIALAMAHAGARGTTAAELAAVLGLPDDEPAYAALTAQLRAWRALTGDGPALAIDELTDADDTGRWHAATDAAEGLTLRVVSRLWAAHASAFLEPFLAVLADELAAPLGMVNFADAPELSRQAINRWIGDQTAHKIDELIPAGTITRDTRLVITSAVHFLAPWATPFEPRATRIAPFFTGHREVNAWYMRMSAAEDVGLARFPGGQLLELPYHGHRFALDVILPTARDGLAAIEDQLAAGALPRWVAALTDCTVDVSLPRFSIASGQSMGDALQALGVRAAFTGPEADFSGIDGTRALVISEVVHQARIDVDERGTEAVAATAVIESLGLPPVAQRSFVADHPFVFLVRDLRTGAILFLGRLTDPSAHA
jgi:serpin B